jgi:probable F420-dependent oxidoreductase
MKFGVLSFITESSAGPAAVAKKSEDLGFESFWLPEHAIIPTTHKTPYPGSRDGKIPEPYYHIVDPFVGLAIAGAATSKIKLGTGICLVPERDPIVMAKEVATVDFFSGGRFIFGIGAGWLRDETEVMGVDFKQRWPMTREYIRAMKELWTKPDASFDGEFVKFPPVKSYPKPAQKPYPPIIIGAGGIGRGNDRAIRDTVAIGDGWGPIMLSAEQLKPELEKLHKLCDEAGRDYRKIEITIFSPVPGPDAHAAVREYEAAGVHRLVLFPATSAPDKYERELEDFARTWM